MKRFLLFSCAFLGFMAFTSCEKCRTCDYKITFGGSSTEGTEENCAKKKDLDDWEADRKKAIEAQVASGATFDWSCVDE